MNLSHQIASKLHEDWRKTRLKEDGTFEPRWKTIKDKGFSDNLDENNLPVNIKKVEDGKFEIDIANSSYDQLSPDWQAENKAAAEVVAQIIESEKEYTIDEVGEIIHSAWLERNAWAAEGPLGVSFAELSKEEQNKDLAQYLIGIETAKELAEAEKDISTKNTEKSLEK